MLNLALQGGGSHGAFTWGVLDALLADGRIQIEGLSGASAGAVNAVALASGWATAEAAGRDPREGARATLRTVWERVSGMGSLGTLQLQLTRMLWGGLPAEYSPGSILGQAWRGFFSPYQSNPLGLNPLRDLLEKEIDFHAIAAHRELKVFVSATHVTTGKAVIFTGRQLDSRAVMASACLPQLFQAVEIDGQPYWDGGFSLNPPLSPLISQCHSADLMLIQINPLVRADTTNLSATLPCSTRDFSPSSTKLLPSRVARVVTCARSKRALGSVCANAMISDPSTIFGSRIFFCQSAAPSATQLPANTTVAR